VSQCGSDAAAKIVNAFEWLGQPSKIAPFPWEVGRSAPQSNSSFLGPTQVLVQNGISISRLCTAHRRVSHYFTMGHYVPPPNKNKIAPSPWDIGSIEHMVLRAHPSHHLKRHIERFGHFCMGSKCYAVQCIVNGEQTPKIAPSLCDFVTPPEEDRATAIGNMHNKNSSGDEIANVNFLRRYGTYVLQNTKKTYFL